MTTIRHAYLLYSQPIEGSRSGHSTFVVLKAGHQLSANNLNTLSDERIEYYFSMYPDLEPSKVKKMVLSPLNSKGIPQVTLTSCNRDRILRGRSRHYFNIKQKEDIPTTETLKLLPNIDTEEGQRYFDLGGYDAAIHLPTGFDIDKAVAQLEDIRKHNQWTAYAPLAKHMPFAKAPDAQNCTSAIRLGFRAGGIDIRPSFALTNASTIQRVGFWLAFSALVAANSEATFSNETNIQKVLLLPLAYAIIRWAMATNSARSYYHDVRQMDRDPNNVGLKTQLLLNAGLITFNTLFCLLSPNAASSVFTFPTHLFTSLQNEPGTTVIYADTPKPTTMPTPCKHTETTSTLSR